MLISKLSILFLGCEIKAVTCYIGQAKSFPQDAFLFSLKNIFIAIKIRNIEQTIGKYIHTKVWYKILLSNKSWNYFMTLAVPGNKYCLHAPACRNGLFLAAEQAAVFVSIYFNACFGRRTETKVWRPLRSRLKN